MRTDKEILDAIQNGVVEVECMGTTVKYFNVWPVSWVDIEMASSMDLREAVSKVLDNIERKNNG